MLRSIQMFILLLMLLVGLQPVSGQTVKIAEGLEIRKLSSHSWMHTTWRELPEWGMIQSNGLLVVDNGEGLLVDTAWGIDETRDLLQWISDSLNVTIRFAFLTHGHDDRMEGIDVLTAHGIASISHIKTADLVDTLPDVRFEERIRLHVGDVVVEAFYPGAGHTHDNIVVWVESEALLFGGCMIRGATSTSRGNVADADVVAWPNSVRKLQTRYPHVQHVIPSHAEPGDASLLQHTIDLFEE